MTPRNANQGQGGNDPCRALLAAVVLQAVDDLSASDETVRWEAHEFFMQPHGGWADMRRFLFDALALNESKVLASLASRLSPPERPDKRLVADDLLALLPNEPFSTRAMMQVTRCGYSQVRGWLESLKVRGLIVHTGRGQFCRVSCYTPPIPITAPPSKTKAPSPPKRNVLRLVLDALHDGPKTIREIGFATDGQFDSTTIHTHLKRAVEEGVVEHDIPFWFLKKIAA